MATREYIDLVYGYSLDQVDEEANEALDSIARDGGKVLSVAHAVTATKEPDGDSVLTTVLIRYEMEV